VLARAAAHELRAELKRPIAGAAGGAGNEASLAQRAYLEGEIARWLSRERTPAARCPAPPPTRRSVGCSFDSGD